MAITSTITRAALLALHLPLLAGAEIFTFHHENVLGTALELRVEAADNAQAEMVEAKILREIDRLSAILSGHDPASEFNRWRGDLAGSVPVSRDLMTVLAACDEWRSRTGGAFDPAVGAAMEVWRDAVRSDRRPDAEAMAGLRSRIESARWHLDMEAGRAEIGPGALVTLDGLAKGYIVDRACDAAMSVATVAGVLVNIGGDLRVVGSLALEAGIANPFADAENARAIARVPVTGAALATSGDYQRPLVIGGQRYNHIFDPRTGAPATGVVSASVLARTATEADALATALNVLSPAEGVALVDGIEGAAALIIAEDGTVTRSTRWPGPAPERISVARAISASSEEERAVATTWGGAYELAVHFEVANPESDGRYRRPYVAIWICDHEGFPIRTLLLWQQKNGLRWLSSLREWYRDDQIRSFVDETDLITTLSRATRPPGQYDVIWDGKDDAGVPVSEGQYTIYIEATREHGTHQTMRTEVELGATPFETKLEGNVEISNARIEYRAATPGR